MSEGPGPGLEPLPGRPADLEGLPIVRLLPRARRRLVGPWCFADAYGPLDVSRSRRMDVAPHPHIGLQTVSWLVTGELLHDDSLGFRGTARPGVLNLMTAGSGIAHAEQSPPGASGSLQGVQLWVALPDGARDGAPGFEQHDGLPAVEMDGGRAVVMMGGLGGVRSPARAFSPLVAAEIVPASRCAVPLEPGFEHAVLLLTGEAGVDGSPLERGTIYYAAPGRRELLVHGAPGTRVLLIGGAPFEEGVLMWWNFVARTSDEIAAARDDWEHGRRFGEVAAYDGPRLAAPRLVSRPVPPNPAS